MTILLIGSTGFLGRHLKARLIAAGHDVKCPTRGQALWPYHPVDAVINAAAELDVVDRMIGSNTDLVLTLLQLQHMYASRLIQIGSSSETGPVEGPRSETTFCQPTNLYEATKLAATNLCLGYSQEWDLDVVVARPFSLYGSGDKPRKLLPTLWSSFCGGKPVEVFAGGHDWLHVDDFVEGILRLLAADRATTKGQIYHFGTGVSTSNEEIVALFERSIGSQLNATHHTARYRRYDVLDWRANWSKARSQLGWEPTISVAQGVNRYVMDEWFNHEKEPGL